MPLIVGALLGTILIVVRVIARLILELGRRLRRVYRAGYAVVPEGTPIGTTIEQPDRTLPLWAARDPVFLDAFGADPIARVHGIRGVRARARDLGMSWRCRSFVVEEVFPAWDALGPNGSEVLSVLSTLWHIPVERIEDAGYPTRRRVREETAVTDSYRATLAWKVDALVEATVNRRLEEIASPGPESVAPEEARQLAIARKTAGWTSASAVIADAMIGAALADEVPPRTVSRLAADWVDLVEPKPDAALEGLRPTERVKRAFGAVPAIVGDHPTLAALLTCVLLGVVLTISSELAGIIVAGLALLFVGLVVRDLRRVGRHVWRFGLGIRPRRPRPQEWVGRRPSPARLRAAMSSIGDEPNHPILVNRLIRLLAASTVWVGLEGPAPVTPERDLDWRRRAGQPLPLAIAIGEGQRFLACFTEEHRHLPDRGHSHVAWTTPLPFPEVIRLAQERDVDVVLVDPLRAPATSIEKEAFPAFLPHQEHENATMHEPTP